ncbi:N-acetylneuraminate synthase family protein [Nonomuraea sp. NPDC049625]|uniref:N-acetylneuraminate synthase family protein n=1 Tax=Nonomuraea sp. NPDC049625 TaxID=3155775 RepID=UPI003445AF43
MGEHVGGSVVIAGTRHHDDYSGTLMDVRHTYFIAEIGINHNGSIDTAQELIRAAAAAGCDAVKFQRRDLTRVYSPEELARPRESVFGATNGDLKRGLEFDTDGYRRLFEASREAGVDCFASVWDEASVEFMAQFKPPYMKVPSPLLGHHGLLRACRAAGVPVLMSTGGADMEDVAAAVRTLGDVAGVMHCVSAYPCPDHHSNVRQMLTLRSELGVPVGYSSHETGPYAVFAATALGAEFLERHITLDRTMWGSDQSVSTEPEELAAMVAGVRAIERSLGSSDVRRLPIEEPALVKLRRTSDYPVANPASSAR